MDRIVYPIRINRYLALQNICSRREADQLISAGQVKINGHVAKLGELVKESDKITLSESVKKREDSLVYIAYNKPFGVVTHSAQEEESEILDDPALKKFGRLFPVGRLDKESHGLIILTNDGRITGKLLEPEREHEKEYLVKTDRDVAEGFLRKMAKGVQLEDFRTKNCEVEPAGPKSFRIILTEGKKHQIRRMCAALGYQTVDLKRIRIMNIKLAGLKEGKFRVIIGQELKTLLNSLKSV